MSDTRYLAIAFSSRIANGHLRTAVTAAAPPDAKVVRTRSDVVAAVFERDVPNPAETPRKANRRGQIGDLEANRLAGLFGLHLRHTASRTRMARSSRSCEFRKTQMFSS